MFWVVGGDERIKNVARNFDGIWMEELGRNLNDTLGKAFEELATRKAAALYIAGDLPFLKPSDLYSMLRSSRRNTNITLAPARRDGGTNAILVPAGLPFRPELGPRSFSKHLSTAAAMQVRSIDDPRENIFGGARFLRILANAFAGDLRKTIAGYNAGEGAVRRYNGIPPYEETQAYVERVSLFYRRYRSIPDAAEASREP